jgi:hypothetical protein
VTDSREKKYSYYRDSLFTQGIKKKGGSRNTANLLSNMSIISAADRRHDLYLSVLELNNLGVDLMEANAFRASTTALREAIHLMKYVVRPVPETASTPTAGNAIFQARIRLLEAQGLSPPRPGSMHWLGAPVRIDCMQMHALDGQNPDIVSATLLYNFGLINRWGGAKCNVLSAGELMEGALRLFSMSYSILIGQVPAVHSDPEDMSEVRLYLLLKVLNALSQIEGELGKHADADAHLEQLERLGRFAIFKSCFDQAIHGPAAPAA